MKNRFFTSPFLFFLPFFFFGMEGSLLSVEYFRAGVFGVEDMYVRFTVLSWFEEKYSCKKKLAKTQ